MGKRASFALAHTPEVNNEFRRPGDVSISVPASEHHTAASWARGSWRSSGGGEQLVAAWSGRKGGRVKAVALGRNAAHDTPIPCDPFERPGRLLVNLSPLDTHWRPLDEAACPPLPAYLPALYELALGEAPSRQQKLRNPKQLQLVAAEPLPPLAADPVPPLAAESSASPDALSFLRSPRSAPPTVLLLGDSTDEDALDQFCRLFQHSSTTASPRGGSDPRLDEFLASSDTDERKKRRRSELRSCELPRADGRRMAVRVLGARFDASRVSELPLAALGELGGADRVDVVMVHSGAAAQQDDGKAARSRALAPQQLEQRAADLRRALEHLRERFPNARLVVRLPHRPQEERVDSNANLAVQQLRHLQREVAQSEGLPVFDFGRVVEGYQFLHDDEHLSLNPAGVVYAQGILHHLRLALERRSSWRRGWLWDS
ncbi:hypothetical protein JCM9279_001427 [Rhodotorula babjevae]